MIGMMVDGIQVPSTYTTRDKKKRLEESVIMDRAILMVLDMTRKPMLTATIAREAGLTLPVASARLKVLYAGGEVDVLSKGARVTYWVPKGWHKA